MLILNNKFCWKLKLSIDQQDIALSLYIRVCMYSIFYVKQLLVALVLLERWLVVGFAVTSWERDYICNIHKASGEKHHMFKCNTETRVFHSSMSSKIHVPFILFAPYAQFLDPAATLKTNSAIVISSDYNIQGHRKTQNKH